SSTLFRPSSLHPPHLHSFPTRRSSDLRTGRAAPHSFGFRAGGQYSAEDCRRALLNDARSSALPSLLPYSTALLPYCLTPLLPYRSEEHTSELQSRFDLVCRLLLEKKNT